VPRPHPLTPCAIATALVMGAVGGWSPAADAHVQPAVDRNNRYLKLSPHGGRVRLVYTVYFGEIPGAAARRNMDTNHDGALSDAESTPVGLRLGEAVRPALEVLIDGQPVPLRWDQIDVGLGAPVVAAGSFSVDLVAWLCAPASARGRGAHHIELRDRFALPAPGETELRAEPDLGVRVSKVTIGGELARGEDVKLSGAAEPLADGWVVHYEVGPEAALGADGCAAGPGGSGRGRGRAWWLALVGAAVLGAGLLGWKVRTSRGTRTSRRSASS
jgi:hypothetical protein